MDEEITMAERMKKRRIKDKIREALKGSFPFVEMLPQICVSGNREAAIEGCGGLLSYDESEVYLDCRESNLRITGRDLELYTFSYGTITVKGHIYKIEFVGRN